MNKNALIKLNPKFKNERKCKNERCGGYFLSETPQDYCPLCREKGFGEDSVVEGLITAEEKKNLLFDEVNTTKLRIKVNDIDRRLKLIEEHLEKKKTFKPKKCSCGKEFTPVSGNQQICESCREKLTK